MNEEIGSEDSLAVSVFTRSDGMHAYYRAGAVYQGHPYDGEYPEMEYTPTQARELAAALLRAADEAEGTSQLADALEGVRGHEAARYAEDALPFAEPIIGFVQRLAGEGR